MLQPKPIALAVALAALTLSGHATALTVANESMEGSITVNGSTAVTQTASTASGILVIEGDADTGGRFGNRTFFYGDLATGTTNIRVLAGADETAVGTESAIVYSALVRNDTDTAITGLTFSFFIGRGRVAVQSEYENAPFNGYAGLSGEITWGDTKLWSVDLDVYSSGSYDALENLVRTHDHALTRHGADDFIVNGSDAEYYYEPYAKTLDLGMLAPGQERLLTYTLGGIGEYVGGGGGDMYGYGGQALVGAYDPFDFDGRPVDEFGNPLPGGLQATAPIPEPGTYAMLGLGLATLYGVTRRRRQRA
jgi:hypothetical protein